MFFLSNVNPMANSHKVLALTARFLIKDPAAIRDKIRRDYVGAKSPK